MSDSSSNRAEVSQLRAQLVELEKGQCCDPGVHEEFMDVFTELSASGVRIAFLEAKLAEAEKDASNAEASRAAAVHVAAVATRKLASLPGLVAALEAAETYINKCESIATSVLEGDTIAESSRALWDFVLDQPGINDFKPCSTLQAVRAVLAKLKPQPETK